MRTIRWNKACVTSAGVALFFLFFLSRTFQREKSPVHLAEQYLDFGDYGNFEPTEEPWSAEPGEGGKPFQIPSGNEHAADVSLGQYHGICVLASDYISLTRSIPDTRQEECKFWNYPAEMKLTASVILVFHNEGFSTLMRTVHSIFKRSPPEMIEEIILVDDCSTYENTKGELEKYIDRFQGKVKLFRNRKREGLIRTRSFGAEQAKGDVIIFLDAHCEVNRNWLPPLLAPIYHDRKTMTVPFIDKIHHTTFQYTPIYDTNTLKVGIWEWGFLYKEMTLSPEKEKLLPAKSAPYPSPTHAGGLFAIDRKYFAELGYYDEGLLIWGGEQYELSFKIWQCGGSILWVPCSRVGHIYRGPVPAGTWVPDTCKISKELDSPYLTLKNHKRVAEVWWEEEFKEYFFTREPLARYLDHGNITKQLAFKRKNQCKSFQWFMDNVSPDQPGNFPPPPPNAFWGELRNLGTSTCLDTMGRRPGRTMGLFECHGRGHQLFRLNVEGQLASGERCIDLEGSEVKIIVCPMGKVDGPWQYDQAKETMYHTRQQRCLGVHPTSRELALRKCTGDSAFNQWRWTESRP